MKLQASTGTGSLRCPESHFDSDACKRYNDDDHPRGYSMSVVVEPGHSASASTSTFKLKLASSSQTRNPWRACTCKGHPSHDKRERPSSTAVTDRLTVGGGTEMVPLQVYHHSANEILDSEAAA